MDIWRFPLARFTLCFIAGIVLASYLRPAIGVLLCLTAMAFTGLTATYITAKKRLRQNICFGIALCTVALTCGAVTQAVHTFYNSKQNYVHRIKADDQLLSLTLKERLKNAMAGSRYVVEVVSIDGKSASGKILLHFKNQDAQLPIGTRIVAAGKIIRNKKPPNPGQFDYGKYLDNKSIPAQLYLKKGNHRIVGTQHNLWFYADSFRHRVISGLRANGFRERELQVLHALILGQQQEISPDVVRDYQFAGAVHILSVSGLHVGFVLLMVTFVLKPLPVSSRWNVVRMVAIVASLWGFAFVAGLSPSVVRSATMFSFIAVGMNLGRSTNIFHTLVISLLLILLFEPEFLFDVGFQLSYAALFFIVWLQPLFLKIWQPENRLIKYFWEIITVSFAAQIGTLPLSIYYFHQFPALFFVTNLVVIPMLSAIMAIGIVVILMAAFGVSVPMLTQLLQWSITLLNGMIAEIAALEQFVITDIPCNFPIMVTAYFSLTALVIWIKKPRYEKLATAVTAVLIFQASVLASLWHARNKSEFIVFNQSKETLIAERNGKELSVFGKPNQRISSYCVLDFVEKMRTIPHRNVFWHSGKKILMLDSENCPDVTPDVVILSQSPRINLERWLKNCRPQIIVADASNFKSYVSLWEATCRKQKIPFHYTNEKGFYALE